MRLKNIILRPSLEPGLGPVDVGDLDQHPGRDGPGPPGRSGRRSSTAPPPRPPTRRWSRRDRGQQAHVPLAGRNPASGRITSLGIGGNRFSSATASPAPGALERLHDPDRPAGDPTRLGLGPQRHPAQPRQQRTHAPTLPEVPLARADRAWSAGILRQTAAPSSVGPIGHEGSSPSSGTPEPPHRPVAGYARSWDEAEELGEVKPRTSSSRSGDRAWSRRRPRSGPPISRVRPRPLSTSGCPRGGREWRRSSFR